jgi:VanZ family protein
MTVISDLAKKGLRTTLLVIPLIYMLVLFIISSTPGEEAPLRDTSILNIKITNILHIPAFTVLFILWFEALKGQQLAKGSCYVYAFAISILFGLFLEFYQVFVPGRYPSLVDILLNVLGVGIGIIIIKWSTQNTKDFSIIR